MTFVAVAAFVQVLMQTQPIKADKVPTANRADVWADSAPGLWPAHCCALQQQAGTAFSVGWTKYNQRSSGSSMKHCTVKLNKQFLLNVSFVQPTNYKLQNQVTWIF